MVNIRRIYNHTAVLVTEFGQGVKGFYPLIIVDSNTLKLYPQHINLLCQVGIIPTIITSLKAFGKDRFTDVFGSVIIARKTHLKHQFIQFSIRKAHVDVMISSVFHNSINKCHKYQDSGCKTARRAGFRDTKTHLAI